MTHLNQLIFYKTIVWRGKVLKENRPNSLGFPFYTAKITRSIEKIFDGQPKLPYLKKFFHKKECD